MWFSQAKLNSISVCLFRATLVAYSGSQARSQIGAVAAWLCHSQHGIQGIQHGFVNCWAMARTPFFFFFFGLYTPVAHESSQARGQIEAAADGLHHSHSNMGSELRFQPTPRLMETLDP